MYEFLGTSPIQHSFQNDQTSSDVRIATSIVTMTPRGGLGGSSPPVGGFGGDTPKKYLKQQQQMAATAITPPQKIFVQIAAYRDPQLVPTIENMLANADDPLRFTFGICWQHGPDEDPHVFDGNAAFRVAKFEHTESKGLCWARSVTQSLYDGEELTLQIDSHHRFVRGWDTLMLADFAKVPSSCEKPILTTYLPPFSPAEYDRDALTVSRAPTLMSQYRFHPGSRLLGSMPWYIPDFASYGDGLLRTRIVSGHFYLTRGEICREVPYDPGLYFGGEIEEVSLSLRAWTSGYDFYSPTRETIAWHEYTRDNRPKHWNDHSDWGQLEARSRRRFDLLCGRKAGTEEATEAETDIGVGERYGLGTLRTLREFQAFAGVDFETCRIKKYTLRVGEPPNPTTDEAEAEEEAQAQAATRSFRVEWDYAKVLDDAAQGDRTLKVLTVGLEDAFGTSLVRSDVLSDFEKTHSKVVEYVGRVEPAKFVLWPLFVDGTWGTRQEGIALEVPPPGPPAGAAAPVPALDTVIL